MKTKLPNIVSGGAMNVAAVLAGNSPSQPAGASPRGQWVLDEDARRRSIRLTQQIVATAALLRANYAIPGRQRQTSFEATSVARASREKPAKRKQGAGGKNQPRATQQVAPRSALDQFGAPTERSYHSLIGLDETEFLTSKRRSGIYEAIAEGTFPKQVKLGRKGRRIGFVYGEIMDWNRAQIAQRDLENVGSKS